MPTPIPAALRVVLYLMAILFAMTVVSTVVIVPTIISSPDSVPDIEEISRSFPLLTIIWVLLLPLTMLITWFFVVYLDRRPFETLGFETQGPWRQDIALGLALGFGLPALIFALSYALGWVHISGSMFTLSPLRILAVLAQTLLAMMAVAIGEETIMRGYVLQTLKLRYGVVAALIVSTLIFSVGHAGNPGGAGIMPFVGIVLAGLGLGYAYLATKRLWLPIAFHFAWNFALGPVFGFPVSGIDISSWIEQQVTGPALFTGGQFGPEAGLMGFAVWLLAIPIIRWYARRTGRD